ncbi:MULTISPECIES: tetratricopeptide repeat protein [unclassified Agrobacterium]
MTINYEFLSDFAQSGNRVLGAPHELSGKNTISFKGGSSTIQFGKNVSFKDVRIEMPNGDAQIIIGDDARLRGLIQIGATSSVEIGERTYFNRACRLSAWEGAAITIGNDCLLSDVDVRTSDMHSIVDLGSNSRINPAADTVIEDHVWLGEGVTVYKGVTIGTGAIVGGHSVVTKTVPRYVAVAGVPAKIIRKKVSWTRELLPMAKKQATPVADILTLLSKDEMSDMLKSGLAEQVIFDIDQYSEARSISFAELENYAQFYYARAHYLCGKFARARELLEAVIRKNPRHKVALELLASLPNASD